MEAANIRARLDRGDIALGLEEPVDRVEPVPQCPPAGHVAAQAGAEGDCPIDEITSWYSSEDLKHTEGRIA